MELETLSSALAVSADGFAAYLGKILLGLAAVGTLAMALVNVFKSLLPIRDRFFQSKVRAVLLSRIPAADQPGVEQKIAEYCAGDAAAFYAQELDNLIAGLNGLKNIAVAAPNSFDWFLDLFSPELRESLVGANTAADKKKYATELTQVITAKLTGTSVLITYRWKMWQQIAGVVLSTLMVLVLGSFTEIFHAIVYGLIGGFIAPFAHDLSKKIANRKA